MDARFVEPRASVVERLLDAATAVHEELGPGLLESAYGAALCCELEHQGLAFEREVEVPFVYRDKRMGLAFRADLVVERELLVELKCVRAIEPVHIAQVVTYLRMLHLRRGYLLNFHRHLMKQGIRRVSI